MLGYIILERAKDLPSVFGYLSLLRILPYTSVYMGFSGKLLNKNNVFSLAVMGNNMMIEKKQRHYIILAI
jgi:hypothetical protein